jgi:hypothetical protein
MRCPAIAPVLLGAQAVTARLIVLRVVFVVLAGLLSFWCTGARASWYSYSNFGGTISGVTPESACQKISYLEIVSSARASFEGGHGWPVYVNSSTDCVVYKDSAHTIPWSTFSLVSGLTVPADSLVGPWSGVIYDNWCNSSASCAASGYVSGGSSGGSSAVTGTVTLVQPDMTSDQIADYMALWSLFLAAGVLVICARAIYARVRLSKYEG